MNAYGKGQYEYAHSRVYYKKEHTVTELMVVCRHFVVDWFGKICYDYQKDIAHIEYEKEIDL